MSRVVGAFFVDVCGAVITEALFVYLFLLVVVAMMFLFSIPF